MLVGFPRSLSLIGNQALDGAGSTTVLFDESHGQANWQQTGFSSRQAATNFAGLSRLLARLGLNCSIQTAKPLNPSPGQCRLLVIPPPTGSYDSQAECWLPDPVGLLSTEEICAVLRYLRAGGRLLAFSYRFGDSFTRTNLGQLFASLGCLLNDDAIVDVSRLEALYPLHSRFKTDREFLPLTWSTDGVQSVLWRTMATFTILNDAPVRPLALSPGGRCLSFNRALRQVSFQSLPLAVAGLYGQGRFVLCGGPHAFETSTLGFLPAAHNARFLENILRWLLSNEPLGHEHWMPADDEDDYRLWQLAHEQWRVLCQVDDHGSGKALVAFVEKLLRDTDTFNALSWAKWAT